VEGLSALGLLLAVIGLAGAISYSVRERKEALGIRMALGAGPSQLIGMVLRQTTAVASQRPAPRGETSAARAGHPDPAGISLRR
jgi:hypothetical protein